MLWDYASHQNVKRKGDLEGYQYVLVNGHDESGNQVVLKIQSDGALFTKVGDQDPNNSSIDTLDPDEEFTGGWTDITEYSSIIVSIKTDQDSATDGLIIEHSSDGVNVDGDDQFNIVGNGGKVFTFMPNAQYFRVRYINGGIIQGIFRLQTNLKKTAILGSSHRIQDSIKNDDDAELVKSILTGQDQVSGIFENVQTFDGALNVTDGLVHKTGLNFFFGQDVGSSKNPNAPIFKGDRTFTINDTSGWVVNDWLHISEGGTVEFVLCKIISLVENTSVTVNRPIDNDYTVAAEIQEKTINMGIDATIPQSFRITAPPGAIWQFTRLLINMTHLSAGDDSKFGGIAGGLTNGILIRVSRSGLERTSSMWFTNADLKTDMYDITYDSKAGGGNNSTSGRWTLTRLGIVAELNGDNGDYLELLLQDASLSGLISFRVKAQGRDFAA